MAALTDADYVCTLDARTLEKAVKELNEDPKNRLGAVDTFRTWLKQQPHLTCRTDTDFLLQFLRYCKFSQLEARKRIEKYLSCQTNIPEWLSDVDYTKDPVLINFFKTGYVLPLGTDDEGRLVIMYRIAQLDFSIDKNKMYKAIMNLTKLLLGQDENLMVNGLLYIMDVSGMTVKHQTFFSMGDMKKSFDLFQNAFPARLKGFHYYNIGPLFETMMQLFLPLFKKKFRDRITMHGDNLESLYKVIPMRLLPEEYLPDDYTGEKNGNVQSIIDGIIKRVQEPESVAYLARISSSTDFRLDESKRPAAEMQASFRKLNVD